jgi:hypothetical protein
MSDVNGVARDQLRAFIERIERLEEEKKSIADDIKDVYAEAKGTGFDTKVLRKGRHDPQAGPERAHGAGSRARSLSACPRHGSRPRRGVVTDPVK